MAKEVKNVSVKQLSHNLLPNDCPYKTDKDKKKVRMVRVVITYYTDSTKKSTDTVSMECCCEHQDRAEQSLRESHGLVD